MMTVRKRWLALFLCLCLCLSALPVSGYAEDTENILLTEDEDCIRIAETEPASTNGAAPWEGGEAAAIEPGDSRSVTLSEPGEVVWFSAAPSRSGTYYFTLSSTRFVSGCVFDADGEDLTNNSEFVPPLDDDTEIDYWFNARAGETYYFRAGLADAALTGTLTVSLTLSWEDEDPDPTETPWPSEEPEPTPEPTEEPEPTPEPTPDPNDPWAGVETIPLALNELTPVTLLGPDQPVYFLFTPAESGWYAFDISNPTYIFYYGIYDKNKIWVLRSADETEYGYQITAPLEAGEPYYIQLESDCETDQVTILATVTEPRQIDFSTFEELKELASRSYTYRTELDYRGGQENVFCFSEDLTVPQNAWLQCWEMNAVIPAGVTVTHYGVLNVNTLQLDGVLRSYAEVNTYGISGSGSVVCGDESVKVNQRMNIQSVDDWLSLQAACLPGVTTEYSAKGFECFVIDRDCELKQSESITFSNESEDTCVELAEGVTLTINGLNFWGTCGVRLGNIPFRIKGTLVNNTGILLQPQYGSRLILEEGGSYSGPGVIRVWGAPDDLSECLPGFDLSRFHIERNGTDATLWIDDTTTLTLDEPVTVTLRADEPQTFVFTPPESGWYAYDFGASSNQVGWLRFYDQNGNGLSYRTYLTDGHYETSLRMTAGEPIYLELSSGADLDPYTLVVTATEPREISFSSFEELKALTARSYSFPVDALYSGGEEPLVIAEDLTTPRNLYLDGWLINMLIPEGITLSNYGGMQLSSLQLDGTLDCHYYVETYGIKGSGSIVLDGGEWSYVRQYRDFESIEEWIAAQAVCPLNVISVYQFTGYDHIVIDRDCELKPGGSLAFYSQEEGSAVELAENVSFTVNGFDRYNWEGLEIYNSLFHIRGNLVNNTNITLRPDQGARLILEEGGSYSGTGSIRLLRTEEDLTDILVGFDLSRFIVEQEGDWTVLQPGEKKPLTLDEPSSAELPEKGRVLFTYTAEADDLYLLRAESQNWIVPEFRTAQGDCLNCYHSEGSVTWVNYYMFLKEGQEYYFFLSTEDGTAGTMTATIRREGVLPAPDIEAGRTVTMDAPRADELFRFVPAATAEYSILLSSDEPDTYVGVLDPDMEVLDCRGSNETWSMTLQAGVCYHIGVQSREAPFSLSLSCGEQPPVGQTYTVSYDANGGSGAPEAQTKQTGEAVALSDTVPTKEGYVFSCWEDRDHQQRYQPGGSYTLDADCTLYAVWRLQSPTLSASIDAATGKPLLTWTAVPHAAGYTLQISGDTAQTLSLSAAEYLDQDAPVGTERSYILTAFADDAENSESVSASLSAVCAKPVLSVKRDNGSGKPVLSWNAVEGAVRYQIARKVSGGNYVTLTSGATGTQYTDTSAELGVSYAYSIRAIDANGNAGAYSAARTFTPVCGAPVLSVKRDDASGKPVLSWDAVEGANCYQIMSKVSGGSYSTLTSSAAGTQYTDSTAKAGTTYVYKIRALDADGNAGSYSAECSFTPTLPRPTGEKTTRIASSGKIRFSWDAVSGAVSYEVRYSTSKSGTYTVLATVTDTRYLHSDAKIDKTYYYKVSAIDSAGGKSALSSPVGATCKVGAPGSAAASNVASSGKPKLSWDAVSGAAKYEVYVSGSKDGSYSKLATVTATSYTHSAAVLDKTYYYKVRALSSGGNAGSYSSVVSVVCKPARLTGVTAKATSNYIEISFPYAGNAAKVEWWWSTSKDSGYKKLDELDDEDLKAFAAFGLDPYLTHEGVKVGTVYYYKLRQISPGGTLGAFSEPVSCTGKLGVPYVSSSAEEYSGCPKLSWSAISYAAKYEVQASTSKSSGFKTVATVTGTGYTHTAAAYRTRYYYRVRAIASDGTTSAWSGTTNCTCVLGKPKLSATNKSDGTIMLGWNTVNNAAKYWIYRKEPGGEYKYVATVTPDQSNTYTESITTVNNEYYYKIIAVDKDGNKSPYSEAVYAYVMIKAPTLEVTIDKDSGKPKLSWNKPSGARNYTVYRSTSKSSGYEYLKSTTSRSFIDTTAAYGKTYYYKVKASNAGQVGVLYGKLSSCVSAKPALGVPAVSVGNLSSNGRIKLSWAALDGAAKYQVQYKESLLGSVTTAATVSGTSHTFASYKLDKEYYFRVRAKDADGNTGPYSAWFSGICLLPAPTNVSTELTSKGTVKITWTAVTNAKKYQVMRCDSKGGNTSTLGTTTGTSYVHSNGKAGDLYYYCVVPVSSGGQSGCRSAVVGRRYQLAKPSVKVADNGSGKPMLSWQKVTDAQKYEIYVSTDGGKNYKLLKTSTYCSYTYTGAKKGTTYKFYVIAKAAKSEGDSPKSNVVSFDCKK